MTKITPTEAIKLTGKARQTIYDAMDSGELSFEQSGPRKRLIDVAELERWNDGLINPDKEQMSEDVFAGQNQTSGSDKRITAAEIEALKERIDTLSDERQRERELLLEQIDDLKQTLKHTQEQQTRLTALLTDQRQDKDKKEAQQQARILDDLRQRQLRLEAELRERDRGFFARWLGAGGRKKKRPVRPAGPATATAQEAGA